MNRREGIAALIVFLVVLTAYGATLMPGTVGGDAGELQYAAPLWALVHPTGQPLYVSLGWLWTTVLPFGPAWEMNLLSAVSTAGGAAALALLVTRLTGSAVAGAAGGLVLGFGGTIWSQAVLPDKYGFNVLLGALLVGMTLLWSNAERAERADPVGRVPFGLADRRLIALSVIFALCVLHHRSLMIFAVSIGVMLVVYRGVDLLRRWRFTLLCAALVLVPPLIGYGALLPLMRARELTPLLWQPTSPTDWIDFLLERHVLTGEALVFDSWENIAPQVAIYIRTLLQDYTLASLPLAVLGFIALLRRDWVGGLFLLVNFLAQAFLSANWRGNTRQFTYYLPSFVLLAYAITFGLHALGRWGARVMGPLPQRHRALLAVGGLAAALPLPVAQFGAAFPMRAADATYGAPLDLWRETVKSADMGARLTAGLPDLPPNAALAADWEQITILWYVQQIEGLRPDLNLFYPIERYADYAEGDTPVCLARHLPVGEQWHPSNVGALICLNRDPVFDAPAGFTPLDVPLLDSAGTPQIALIGYRIGAAVTPPGRYVPLTLVWRAAANPDADYAVSLRLLNEQWAPAAPARDIAHPVMGMYPTSRWVDGEVVTDYHEIDVPPATPHGRYLVTVVIYHSATLEPLRDAAGNVNLLVTTLEVR